MEKYSNSLHSTRNSSYSLHSFRKTLLERLLGAVAWIRPLGARGGAGTAAAWDSPRRWWRTELAHQRSSASSLRGRACGVGQRHSTPDPATVLVNGHFSPKAFSWFLAFSIQARMPFPEEETISRDFLLFRHLLGVISPFLLMWHIIY
jgi:hypothetical protein